MNKTVLHTAEGGAIRVSSVQEFDAVVDFTAFSAKYVVKGCEHYRIQNRTYPVHSGEYITGNSTTNTKITIDSPQPVLGICIDVNPLKLQEIITFEYGQESPLQDFLFTQERMVNRYNAQHTYLGYAIRQIEHYYEALRTDTHQLHPEIFYSLGECIVKDHAQLMLQFQRLEVVKRETSQRLFDFINDARIYIDRHFLEDISLMKMAAVANLSEYHFIRLFKKAFQQTPYQYVLHLRLMHAHQMIKDQFKIADVAMQTGFTDTAAFSKAFKKKFGIVPSLL